MFAISLAPARGQSNEAGSVVASSSVTGPMASLGATVTTAGGGQPDPYDSSTDDDLRCCAQCGEQQEYCHGHTLVVPNPTLNLPPRIPVQGSISTNSMAQFNLNCAQATVLVSRLINTLEQDGQNPIEVLPPYDYAREFMHVLAEGLRLNPTQVAKGLGLHGRGGPVRGQNQGGQPCPVPDAQ
jgi:hypothetical protein